MPKEALRKIHSENKIEIQQGLEELARRLPALEGAELETAMHGVFGLFSVDPIDHPELIPVLEQAEDLLAGLRERAIPPLLAALRETDLKVHFRLAAVLGKMGYAAVAPLVEANQGSRDTYVRVFTLYALGKVRDPRVLEAFPVLFAALDDPEAEVRDTAARALGKVCEHLDPARVPAPLREQLFERLLAKTGDRFAGVRSKALRSLGKMAKFGFLDGVGRARLAGAVARALGENDEGNWDLAYVVRAEAEKARRYL